MLYISSCDYEDFKLLNLIFGMTAWAEIRFRWDLLWRFHTQLAFAYATKVYDETFGEEFNHFFTPWYGSGAMNKSSKIVHIDLLLSTLQSGRPHSGLIFRWGSRSYFMFDANWSKQCCATREEKVQILPWKWYVPQLFFPPETVNSLSYGVSLLSITLLVSG